MKKKENIKPVDENGLEHGLWINYYRNGNIMYKSEWVHGKLHGICKEYFTDGNLYYKCNFKMDKLYGLDIQYKTDKSGQIEYKKIHL